MITYLVCCVYKFMFVSYVTIKTKSIMFLLHAVCLPQLYTLQALLLRNVIRICQVTTVKKLPHFITSVNNIFVFIITDQLIIIVHYSND